MKFRTPAKINIGLNVIGKREDGYHDIETVFYPVRLFDEFTITPSEELTFHCSNKVLETDENNLVLKAVKALEEETGRVFKIEIFLQKNIPIGGGLGGGSSDAAAVLMFLDKKYELNLTLRRLSLIALKLGSDVPFFLNPLPSFAEGRGEKLEPLNFQIPYPVLIVNPGIHVSTKMAFEKIKPFQPLHDLRKILLSTPDYAELKEFVKNDFETVIFNQYPEIGELKSYMYYSGAVFSLMTGTGASVFGIFPDMDSAVKAGTELKKNYYTFIHSSV